MEPYPDQIELLIQVATTADLAEQVIVADLLLLLKGKATLLLQDQHHLLRAVVVVAAAVEAAVEVVAQHVAEVEARFIF